MIGQSAAAITGGMTTCTHRVEWVGPLICRGVEGGQTTAPLNFSYRRPAGLFWHFDFINGFYYFLVSRLLLVIITTCLPFFDDYSRP